MSTQYRAQSPTLASILAKAGVAMPAPDAPQPGAGLAQAMSQQPNYGGVSQGAQDTMKMLEDQAFAPNPEAPGPAKLDWGHKIGLALANALSTYSATMSHGQATDYLAPALDRLDREKNQKYRKDLGDTEVKRDKARFQLERRLSGEDRTAKEAARKDEAAAAVLAKNDQIRYEAGVRAEDRAARMEQIKFEQDAATQRNREDNARSLSVAASEARAKAHGEGDKGAAKLLDEQRDEFSKVKQWAVAKKGEYKQAIESGQAKPEDVRQMLSDMISASDLDGKYREAAVAFLQSQFEPILSGFEQRGTSVPNNPAGPAPGASRSVDNTPQMGGQFQ